MIKAMVVVMVVWLACKWVISLCARGQKNDEAMRRSILIEQAKNKYPQLELSAALDRLYAEILRRIKSDYKLGKDTTELQDDLFVILDERHRIMTEEESSLHIVYSQKSI